MSNQAEFEHNLAALISEFKTRGVSNQQIREALQDHISDGVDDTEMSQRNAPQQELDYGFRKRIRAAVPPDDKDLAAEVEAAIGVQLDDVGARCGLYRYSQVA